MYGTTVCSNETWIYKKQLRVFQISMYQIGNAILIYEYMHYKVMGKY